MIDADGRKERHVDVGQEPEEEDDKDDGRDQESDVTAVDPYTVISHRSLQEHHDDGPAIALSTRSSMHTECQPHTPEQRNQQRLRFNEPFAGSATAFSVLVSSRLFHELLSSNSDGGKKEGAKNPRRAQDRQRNDRTCVRDVEHKPQETRVNRSPRRHLIPFFTSTTSPMIVFVAV